MADIPNLELLKAQLLTSGLQEKNQPLFQIINQLISIQRQTVDLLNAKIIQINNSIISNKIEPIISPLFFDMEDSDSFPLMIPGMTGASGPIGPAGATGTGILVMSVLDGEPGEDGYVVPGPTGSQGIQGIPGITPISVVLFNDEPEETLTIPGPSGQQGIQGIQGIAGINATPIVLFNDEPDEVLMIPGQAGPAGVIGPTGPQGIQGVIGPVGFDNTDYSEDFLTIPGPSGNAGSIGPIGPMGPILFNEPDEPEFSLIPGPPGPNGIGAYVQLTPATPANVAASTAAPKMLGLASGISSITPISSGIIAVFVSGVRQQAAVNTWLLQVQFGTGVGPANAAALTGTLVGSIQSTSAGASTLAEEACLVGLITGLAVGTPIWIDVAAGTGAASITLASPSIVLIEVSGAGAQGPIGLPGATGPTGSDGEDVEYFFLPGPQGPALSLTDFTKDLGASNRSGTFDITGLSGLTPNKNVIVIQTRQPIASKGNAQDESEMDIIDLIGIVLNTTTIRVTWFAPSTVVGIYAFAYLVGA